MAEKKYKFKTSNAREVRQTLSTLVNLLANGEIEPKVSNAITYVCNAILQGIRTDELEQKILKLEEYYNESKGVK